MRKPNFFRDIEAINDRINIATPSTDDLLAIAEACRWSSVTHDDDGTALPMGEPKAHNHFFGNYGTQRIRKAVHAYAARYDGDFEFMVEMEQAINRHGSLSMKQAAAVLNVMLAEAKRTTRRTGDLPATLARVA